MMACVILHNIIIEYERDLKLELLCDKIGSRVKPSRNLNKIQPFLEIYRHIEDKVSYIQLRDDLIEHQFQLYGR